MFADGTLFYPKNSTELRPDDLATLETVACSARATENRVVVEGFASADERDSERLSLRRAIGVKDLLVEYGVKSEQIAISAHGAQLPIASDGDTAGRAKNRRVDFTAGQIGPTHCGGMHRSQPRT
ncbi:OmpA family protein [Variovorax gossypii]